MSGSADPKLILRRFKSALSARKTNSSDAADTNRDVLEQVALLGHFDLDWLNHRTGQSALRKSAVLNVSEPLDTSLNVWRMRGCERELRLKALVGAPERLAKRLHETPPLADDDVGRALQAMLAGHADFERADDTALAAMLDAATWLKDIKEIPSPDPRTIRRELSRRRLNQRLDQTAARFVGRGAELDRLQQFADGPPPHGGEIPVLSVFGIGGIGKSALLSRLLQGRLRTTPTNATTPLLFHCDFDRFAATEPTALEWTFELSRQLAFLLPEAAAELDKRRKQIQRDYVEQSRSGRDYPNEASQQFEAATFSSGDFTQGLYQLTSSLSGRRPLLMVFDTVETLQVSSVEGLWRLGNWISDLRMKAGFADIRVVLCGRVEAMLPGPAFKKIDPPIELDELERDHAIGLLEKLKIPADQAALVVDEFGGNPLILRLIAQLAARGGLDLADFASTTEERAKADKEVVQGILYQRILRHVRDDTVRELAHPGLVLRRVTKDTLRYVIAKVCLGHEIDDVEARKLYDSLSSEVWLVDPAPDGGEGVVHRSDLRKLTMKLIARDPEEMDRTQQIHLAAIEYYETGPGRHAAYAADEALYHKFMVRDGSQLPHLDRETAERARKAIAASIDELPHETRVALHAALDQSVELKDALHLPNYLWERYVARRGSELSQRDAFAQALSLTEARALPPSAARPEWRSAALDALARWHELFDELGATGSTGTADPARVAQLSAWIAAGLKSGRFGPASEAPSPVRTIFASGLERMSISPPLVTLHAYLLRTKWDVPASKQLSCTTTDLLTNPDLAAEFVRYLQVRGEPYKFRPVRSQFYPSIDWLLRLQTKAGDIAGPALAAFIEDFRHSDQDSIVIGRILGHYSTEFERLWTDAYARNAVPSGALEQLIAIREFPEFRVPARIALLETLDSVDTLRELTKQFVSTLPLVPSDLVEPGLERALLNPHAFLTGLVAYADRCQCLYGLLTVAASLKPASPRITAVQSGMKRWFTAAETALYASTEAPTAQSV